MKCIFLKYNRYCTNCHAFANQRAKPRQCGYKKNPQKCPLIKGTRFEEIFTQDFNKSVSDLLQEPQEPIPLLNTDPIKLTEKKDATKNL